MKEKLKNLRISAGLSQDALAAELGVAKSSISSWENGKRTPDSMHLLAYVKAFDLDEDFFDDGLPKKSNVGECFDMTRLNVRGAKKMYDLYLSLLENEEYLKKS